MESVYYSPRGYWKGKTAIIKLAGAAKVKKTTAANWMAKQAIWQIYLPPPKQFNFSHFDVSVLNEVRQADILFLPHDGGYKYALHLKGFIDETLYAGQIYYKLIRQGISRCGFINNEAS